MNLFRRRSVADLQAEVLSDLKLKRALGPVNLTALGIGAIIGAGIFVLTGHAAAQYAGPGIVYSFILSGLACAFAGLCYAEFASMIPLSGSAYTYGYATLGEFVAWIIGWSLILEYLFAAGTVAVGWSGYVVSLLKDMHIVIPAAFTSAPYDHTTAPGLHWYDLWQLFAQGWTSTGAVLNVPAMLIVAVLTILLVLGIKESVNFNNAIVAIKLAVILTFLAVGVAYINKNNWHPFVPPNVGPGEFGWSGVVRAAGVIFFAYIGFDAVSTAAQESRNPQRDMPIALLASLGICTVLYITVSLVLTGIVNYTQLNVPAPIAVAVSSLGPSLHWLVYFIKIGAIARAFVSHPGHVVGPAADILHHVQGRPVAARFQHRAPEISDAVDCANSHRRNCDAHCRAFSHRSAGRTGFHRHPAGVCHGLCRRVRFAVYRSGDSAALPHAVGLAGGAARRFVMPVAHDRLAAGHLGAAHRLDDHRLVHLLRLQLSPLETEHAEPVTALTAGLSSPPRCP